MNVFSLTVSMNVFSFTDRDGIEWEDESCRVFVGYSTDSPAHPMYMAYTWNFERNSDEAMKLNSATYNSAAGSTIISKHKLDPENLAPGIVSLGAGWRTEIEARYRERFKSQLEKQRVEKMESGPKRNTRVRDAADVNARPADFFEVRQAFLDQVFGLRKAPTTEQLTSIRNWVRIGQEWDTSPTWFLFLKSIGRYPLTVLEHPWEAHSHDSDSDSGDGDGGEQSGSRKRPRLREELWRICLNWKLSYNEHTRNQGHLVESTTGEAETQAQRQLDFLRRIVGSPPRCTAPYERDPSGHLA
ncbi:hypothetical protein E8E13_004605 [Curvularia kusanoi]|uniref:Uncharacterized protein n=1 Tax=Curvularia kusanoi TaxID=90978 RepID=A0A9P4TJ96_CURKU|nr:hypothetical protein E8E13_004605 [Curvularia kusanoi]